MEDCKAMSTPINQKEKLVKEDGSAKVDEVEFKKLDRISNVLNNNQT